MTPHSDSVAATANHLALLYAQQGGPLGMALALAQAAAERAPGHPGADDTLGWIYYQNGLPLLAIAALKRSIEKDPANPVYRCQLALAYVRSGDWERAKRSLEQAAWR